MIEVTRVPVTTKMEYKSQVLRLNRRHDKPMMRMTTFAMKISVNIRNIHSRRTTHHCGSG